MKPFIVWDNETELRDRVLELEEENRLLRERLEKMFFILDSGALDLKKDLSVKVNEFRRLLGVSKRRCMDGLDEEASDCE